MSTEDESIKEVRPLRKIGLKLCQQQLTLPCQVCSFMVLQEIHVLAYLLV
uniref:Bm2706, isoform a; Bm2706, isoform b n=1 Tax=Brugia malayi TaxID=6279 RepID=A0A8L7SZK6_BRUMA